MKPYIVALLVVIGVLAGFYGGYRMGQNNVSANTGQNSAARSGNFGAGFQGGGAGRGGGGFGNACPSPGAPSPSPGGNAVATGTITDLTSSSLTITSTACDVKVEFGNTVQISKTTTGTTSDLKDNITVTIIGTRQADGSIKATAIQIGGTRIGIRAGASPSPGG
ncbi:MAG TPA: hypothetical protein VKE27_10170 [Candidatus Dormibacteraeota bacterium]|nr:hypothetical protein [Candidatus Dormibacteraeota bacterium]